MTGESELALCLTCKYVGKTAKIPYGDGEMWVIQ